VLLGSGWRGFHGVTRPDIADVIPAFFAERDRRARPVQWTYITEKLLAKVRRRRRTRLMVGPSYQ
jgi:hypothetical protein